MKIVVGLGNPGTEYEKTRHNAGFLAIDSFIGSFAGKADTSCSKYNALVMEARTGTDKIFFVKPQTFMNNSGRAVKQLCDFYKIDISKDLLVVHDEKDLPFGTVRMTKSSSSAGHNGVQSVIEALGTQDFHRIRIGVESRPEDSPIDTTDFVLQNFSNEEFTKLQSEILPAVKKVIVEFLKIEN